MIRRVSFSIYRVLALFYILNDEAISVLSKALNEKIYDKNESNEELLKDLEQKLDKVNKEISNILNAIVNNMLKDKIDELEQVKLNLDFRMNELKRENKALDVVCITEEEIRIMFLKFKAFVLEIHIPECK
ncbi:hypothetical protein [Paraclostridium sordellii]|uniref:hypothetical protein n=1 Tax=Paraclostridium sordellii TaxID=1505 RepID=UPI001F2F8225|nr:hypothetical protein [Paeniclostridium sordellii]MDU5021479.1 hypothetical protein [Clostridiales bacterium]